MVTEIQTQLLHYAASALQSAGGSSKVVELVKSFNKTGKVGPEWEGLHKEAENVFESGYPNGGDGNTSKAELSCLDAVRAASNGDGEAMATSVAYAFAAMLGWPVVCNGMPNAALHAMARSEHRTYMVGELVK